MSRHRRYGPGRLPEGSEDHPFILRCGSSRAAAAAVALAPHHAARVREFDELDARNAGFSYDHEEMMAEVVDELLAAKAIVPVDGTGVRWRVAPWVLLEVQRLSPLVHSALSSWGRRCWHALPECADTKKLPLSVLVERDRQHASGAPR